EHAIDRRQALRGARLHLAADEAEAMGERAGAQTAQEREALPLRAAPGHRREERAQEPAGRDIEVALGDASAAAREIDGGVAPVIKLVAQGQPERAEIDGKAAPEQHGNAEIDVARMAIELIGTQRTPARQHEELRRNRRNSLIGIEAEKGEP